MNDRENPRTGRTQIPERLYPLRDLQALFVVNHDLLSSSGPSPFLLLITTFLPQIALQRHKHEFHALTILGDLAHPLRLDVLERVFRINAEAEHDSVSVIVRKRAQAIEFLLAGGVPEGEFYVDIIDEDIMDIVFEDSGLVYCRKVAAIAPGA